MAASSLARAVSCSACICSLYASAASAAACPPPPPFTDNAPAALLSPHAAASALGGACEAAGNRPSSSGAYNTRNDAADSAVRLAGQRVQRHQRRPTRARARQEARR